MKFRSSEEERYVKLSLPSIDPRLTPIASEPLRLTKSNIMALLGSEAEPTARTNWVGTGSDKAGSIVIRPNRDELGRITKKSASRGDWRGSDNISFREKKLYTEELARATEREQQRASYEAMR